MIPSSKDQIKEKILTDHNSAGVRSEEKRPWEEGIRAKLSESFGGDLDQRMDEVGVWRNPVNNDNRMFI